jgi:hypothetical protein
LALARLAWGSPESSASSTAGRAARDVGAARDLEAKLERRWPQARRAGERRALATAYLRAAVRDEDGGSEEGSLSEGGEGVQGSREEEGEGEGYAGGGVRERMRITRLAFVRVVAAEVSRMVCNAGLVALDFQGD